MDENQDRGVILVVEDDPKNIKLIRDLLVYSGYRVLEATDGRQGVELARSEQPDLILMDIQMPLMDGLEATRLLKGDERTRDIPVIALTAYAMPEDRSRIFAAGCEGHIPKPIDTRSFLETVKLYLLKDRKPTPVKGDAGGRSHRWKILIVDDDPKALRLFEALLPAEKYDVVKAQCGAEALEQTSQEQPDLVLLDIIMPDIDGLEVARRLKHDEKTKNIPIILVTSLDDWETKEIGIESGAEEFLVKPVQALELQARVNSMIRLKQFRDQLSIRSQSAQVLGIPAEEPVESPEKNDQAPCVLLVEDNDVDAKNFQEILKSQPFRLETVRTGLEVLSRVQQGGVDLILLDILLPDLDGFEICRRLKNQEESKDTQVVIVTCLGDVESKIKGIELGAEDFLVKPIVPRELIARVKILLEKKGYLDKLRSHYETALDSAKIDWLTGLHNHGYFKQFLRLELKRSVRQNYPVSLILIDVDNFKSYNDTLGHAAGDLILREMGRVITNTIREVDLVARYGGEEFAVVLPYAAKDRAQSIADRIQKAILSHDFLHKRTQKTNHLTVSMGVSTFPEDVLSPEELIERADQMLYKAKHNGKNQFCVCECQPEIPNKG